jgi:hypothetical protein
MVFLRDISLLAIKELIGSMPGALDVTPTHILIIPGVSGCNRPPPHATFYFFILRGTVLICFDKLV